MKKLLKQIAVGGLAGLVSFGVVGCNRGGESVDESKTQLYVATFAGGFGSSWMDTLADRFETKYANVSFETGCAILAEYISKIRSINRYNFYLKPKNIFLHNSLAQLVHYMSSPGDIKNKLQHIPSKNRDFVLQRYPTLITQIQMLRRYKNE